MSTHEVDGRQVERSSTSSASSDLEDLRRRTVGKSFDLLLLCSRFGSIGRNESSVLIDQ